MPRHAPIWLQLRGERPNCCGISLGFHYPLAKLVPGPSFVSELHLWVPDLDAAKGGIQAFSHCFWRGLRAAQPSVPVRVFAKRGSADPNEPHHRSYGHIPSTWRTLWFITSLVWAALRHRPAAVISTHSNFLPAAHMLKRLWGIPYLGIAHGIEVWGNRRPAMVAALRAADRILAVSRYTRDRLASEQGIATDRLGILPNTFDEARFHLGPKSPELLARYQIPADAKIIFTFGRLAMSERYKGFDKIITALPRLQRAVPEVRYLIGGSGDDQSRLAALAQAVGVADRVTFTGFLPTTELAAHYQLCDVFAMPSTGEGFGIVFLEALACGKPVLAGDRDGSVDPLLDGRLGALVDPHDAEQLAESLTQILQRRYAHPLMWKPEELRRQVVAEFGFEKFSAILQAHLQRLLLRAA